MSSIPASVHAALGPALRLTADHVEIVDAAALATPAMDTLVRLAVFGSPDEKAWARWVIWEAGRAVGTFSASIHAFYMARGRGDVPPVTV
ncbi:MAG: hypothetical protein RL139_240, partial [Gemmatimonadota bacterium]